MTDTRYIESVRIPLTPVQKKILSDQAKRARCTMADLVRQRLFENTQVGPGRSPRDPQDPESWIFEL